MKNYAKKISFKRFFGVKEVENTNLIETTLKP